MSISYWFFCFFLLISLSFGGGTPDQVTTGAKTPRQSTPNDVAQHTDFLGNPFYARFWADHLAYDRNVWDMEVYDGRLYFGHGNSNNMGPGGDPGPIELWYYDDKTQAFNYDHILDDEQIDQFVLIGDSMFIPGHDSTTNQPNIYQLKGSQWLEWGNLPRALHVYDIYDYLGTYYVALGVGGSKNQVIASTNDDGATWQTYRLAIPPVQGVGSLFIYRAWQFFQVGADLLVSIQPPNWFLPIHNENGTVGNLYQTAASPIYRLVNGTQPHFEQVYVDFFAGLAHPEVDWIEGRVARPVRFDGKTVYLGVKTVTDHNWTPFGLFSVDDSYNVSVLSVGDNLVARDLLVDQGALYVLASQALDDGTYTVSVQETCNLEDWREVLQFRALTFSRSFALYDGDFYFGQGTEIDPMSNAAGNVARVGAPYFTRDCP